MDREIFYQSLELRLLKTISPSQKEGMEVVLNEWDSRQLTDVRHLAYMLSTAYHETAHTMQPVSEFGKGKGRLYGKKIKRSGVAYTVPDFLYYGRGFVQLTWYENYEMMARLLHVDLLNIPSLALKPDIAVKIMFEGMLKGASSIGDFTGKCLEMYFNDHTEDPIGARKIINGTDRAELIAGYYASLKDALLVSVGK